MNHGHDLLIRNKRSRSKVSGFKNREYTNGRTDRRTEAIALPDSLMRSLNIQALHHNCNADTSRAAQLRFLQPQYHTPSLHSQLQSCFKMVELCTVDCYSHQSRGYILRHHWQSTAGLDNRTHKHTHSHLMAFSPGQSG